MSQLDSLVKYAGLHDVRAETKTLPVGSWGGRVGKLLAQDMLAGWPSMRPLARSLVGVPAATFDEVIGQLEAEWNDRQTTYEVYCVCGQV